MRYWSGLLRNIRNKSRYADGKEAQYADSIRCSDATTVYSSPDNTVWYFMPEIGDSRLHFPTEREWEGYVISSVHEGGRADTDIKSIRTKWAKEIVFTPSSIYINNGAGSISYWMMRKARGFVRTE